MYEDEKFKIANGLYPGRWGTSKNMYLKCVSFRRESQKIQMPDDSPHGGASLWQAVERVVLDQADFTNTDSRTSEHINDKFENLKLFGNCLNSLNKFEQYDSLNDKSAEDHQECGLVC